MRRSNSQTLNAAKLLTIRHITSAAASRLSTPSKHGGLGFNLGNVVKYIARAGYKTADSLQDLRKAAWYLDREIKRINSKAPDMVK